MSHSGFSTQPFSFNSNAPASPESQEAACTSILAALQHSHDADLEQDLQRSSQGNAMYVALSAVKGVAPILNALSASDLVPGSDESLTALETMLQASDLIAQKAIKNLGIDLSGFPWAIPMARTILTHATAERWEKNHDITAEQLAEQFAPILQVAMRDGLPPEFGADWDLVQPQAALAISLSAAVDNVMAEYDNAFNFFRDRADVVQEVTDVLLASSRDVLAEVEERQGEIGEPSRTRLLQATVREGGLLLSRLWRPEAKRAIAEIRTLDPAEKIKVVKNGGYPLDRLFTRFREAQQTHVLVLLGAMNLAPQCDETTSAGPSPG